MVTQCWHFSLFPTIGLRDLHITWNLFPHVSKWMFAVNRSTAMPRGAGRLTVATSPAVGSRGSSHSKTQHLYALSMGWHRANRHTVWWAGGAGPSAEEEAEKLHQTRGYLVCFSRRSPALWKREGACWCLKHSSAIANATEVLGACIVSNANLQHCAAHAAV